MLITRDLRTSTVEQIAAVLIANLPQIEQFLLGHGNALLSLTPTKPIRAEFLPIYVAGERPGS